MTQILATDFGPHPADKWALATAAQIVPLGAVTDASRQIAALRLQANVAEVLEPHHEGVHQAARASIKANATAHFATGYDPTTHTADAVKAVAAAAVGTPWEAHFADPAVQAQVGAVIASHFATGEHIERAWHADRNPGFVPGQVFKALHHPAVADTPVAAATPAPATAVADAKA